MFFKNVPQDGHGGLLAAGEKKRKRTSIAAPEKRSLEAYFAVQVGLFISANVNVNVYILLYT